MLIDEDAADPDRSPGGFQMSLVYVWSTLSVIIFAVVAVEVVVEAVVLFPLHQTLEVLTVDPAVAIIIGTVRAVDGQGTHFSNRRHSGWAWAP